MGRKQRDMSSLKPFCFYCQKTFRNQVILHHHQKAKHFHCPKCPKKFSSIDSMTQHAKTSHNINVQKVPNANPGRGNIGLKIFGMQGVPRIDIQNHIHKNVQKYWEKIVESKRRKQRQQEQILRKQQLAGQNHVRQNQIDQNQQKMQEEQHPEENLDFPLEFSIPQQQ